jgi:hypothetical protein
MDEPAVVDAVKKYLSNNGWRLVNNVPGKIGNERFIPDIVAYKRGKILSVECKGSLDLEGVTKGVGQCIQHQYYGSNFIYLAVPEDISKQAQMMIKNITLSGGKIGLLAVKRSHKVDLVIKPKELKLTKELKRLGKNRRQKLAFVRDLKVDELGGILEFASQHKGEYKNKKELEDLLLKNKTKIFPKRKSISHKSILNALITPTNLGLMDEFGNLTDEGETLKDSHKISIEKYKEDLSAYLLINGNWMALLQIIEEGKLKVKGDINKLADLIEKHELIDEGMSKTDYARRVSSQYFKWLKDLDIIKIENGTLHVDWIYVIKVLSSKVNLNI